MGLVERLVGRGRGTRVGIFVDGPNVFRPEFDVDLDELREIAGGEGTVAVARVYVDANAGSGLIQAAEARGFEVVTTSGDVDVKLAVEAVEATVDDRIDTVIVVSRDTDFKPVLEIAAKRGLRTVAVAPGTHGRSDALRNAAHREITLQ
ncbi:MAG: NYN domain-containing protein [Halobacteriota archaeon]|uniref:NYN domain-containing protein n=1 Tax=Natronomonas sp. TaxID=2184060 RepID=UPI00397513C3